MHRYRMTQWARLYRAGPDSGSTYAECWGATARSYGDIEYEGSLVDCARRLASGDGGLGVVRIIGGYTALTTQDDARILLAAATRGCKTITVDQGSPVRDSRLLRAR